MDPRGAAPDPLSVLGDFPRIRRAREATEVGLLEKRHRLDAAGVGGCVALMGSWGRREVTHGSDTDWLLLGAGHVAAVERVLGRAAGSRDVFNTQVDPEALAQVGAAEETTQTLTLRILLLTESVAVTRAEVHQAAIRTLLDAYLGGDRRDRRPPRFLLNDLVRYWRTIAVEFEGKGARKWALRHAKLRTSRSVLFAGGLLPVLEGHHVAADDVEGLLLRRFAEPPVDRIARAFTTYDAQDAGARTLQAYDRFLGMLDDPQQRARLESLAREDADGDAVFQDARRLGREVQQGLLALLFEREPLRRLVRQYLIF